MSLSWNGPNWKPPNRGVDVDGEKPSFSIFGIYETRAMKMGILLSTADTNAGRSGLSVAIGLEGKINKRRAEAYD